MKPPVSDFWAKLKPYRGDPVESWHPLVAHSADVAACLEALLDRSIVRARLARLAGLENLSPVQAARLSVLAALHDLGKFNIGFQNKKLARPPFTAGHVGEILAAFGTEIGRKIAEALQLERMLSWGESERTLEDLLITSFAHHGRPQAVGGLATPGAWAPNKGLNPFEGIAALQSQVQTWYPAAFEPGGEPLPDSTGFQHAFNGVLTLADWLGSNEVFFPFAEAGDASRIEFARQRASEAVRFIGLDARPARSELIEKSPQFEDVWPFAPRPAQRILQEMPVEDGGSVTILEAPTGSGKTEAALIRFLRLFSAGEVDGLYFALPTRAAATQIHGRVQAVVESVIPDPEHRPPVVLAVPGYLGDEGDKASILDELGALWADDDRRWRYLTWASERPKRFLAGVIIVGTVDQALLSTLAVNHSHMRAASLLRHLLVVDEVHASDAYMSRLLEQVLDRHLAARGHALLMSATLGEVARRRYLSLTSESASDKVRLIEEAVSIPYPAVHHSRPQDASTVRPVEALGLSQKSVEVELVPAMERPEAISERLSTAVRHGASVLGIRNTVGGCLELQEALERTLTGESKSALFRCAGVAAPHHSRFAQPDRKLLDQAVEQAYGKETRTSGVILAATQTVEQSLDIDADLLVTDLCPADVLLQRIGRLHRHDRDKRPESFQHPRVVVLVPESEDLAQHIVTKGDRAGQAFGPHGIGTVYEDMRVLAATWQLLRERRTLRLPAENRRLVEEATHPSALRRIVEEHGGAWITHQQRIDGIRQARREIARLNLADWSVPFGSPRSLFPEQVSRRIQTRLGEGDRRAVLTEPVDGPFRRKINEFTIPTWMARDVGEEAEVVPIEAGEGTIRFAFGARTYRYDRWGLRPVGDEDS